MRNVQETLDGYLKQIRERAAETGYISIKEMAFILGTSPMFVFLLIFIVILVGALSFFPALALGPVAEFLGSAV